jgi:hypothetical protein
MYVHIYMYITFPLFHTHRVTGPIFFTLFPILPSIGSLRALAPALPLPISIHVFHPNLTYNVYPEDESNRFL